jgi:hypothetical protein
MSARKYLKNILQNWQELAGFQMVPLYILKFNNYNYMNSLSTYIDKVMMQEGLANKQRELTKYQASHALVSPYVFITKDGKQIPCHNKATLDYYKEQEALGKTIS